MQLQYALVYLKNMGKEEDVLRMTVAGAMKTASYLPIEQKHGYLKLQVDSSKFGSIVSGEDIKFYSSRAVRFNANINLLQEKIGGQPKESNLEVIEILAMVYRFDILI